MAVARMVGRAWRSKYPDLAAAAVLSATLAALFWPLRGAARRSPAPAPAAPTRISLRGWGGILARTRKEVSEDHVPLLAGGITFYTLLALFPGIGAFASLYGLVADVADARRQVEGLAAVLPAEVVQLVAEEMERTAAAHPAALSAGFILGLALALWSANGAMKAIFLGLNIAYEAEERRGFLRLALTSLAFTAGVIGLGVLMIASSVALFAAAQGTGPLLLTLLNTLRWAVLGLIVVLGVSALYRWGPSHDPVHWRWFNWGSTAGAAVWLGASLLFSAYLSHFGHYQATYGALGAVVGFMMWTYLSTIIFLAGAELNAEIEAAEEGGNPPAGA